jgi:hypothetical protein
MTELIITNGDTAADLLLKAGRDATVLPWRDVLHEGPILPGLLAQCSLARIAYLADRFRVDPSEVAADFAERDDLMRAHGDFEKVELWFEHDLYDQLQLVQVLAFFAGERPRDGLILVQADDFLGSQTAETILGFADKARPVSAADLDLAAAVWADLTQPTPAPIAARLNRPAGSLTFLRSALRRFLEELPAPASGLGRTEYTLLDAIARGTNRPASLFHQMIAEEEAAFMGDWSFFRLIDDLAFGDVPLIAGLSAPPDRPFDGERFHDADLALTMAGEDVLSGEDDNVVLNGLDRWWAGTRLTGRAVWRFDREAARLVPPEDSGA